MLLKSTFAGVLILVGLQYGQAQLAQPLPNGHAHNDYEKPWKPLTKALEQGFVSIEIDVFPYKNQLKVAHVGLFLDAAQDLETMYFKPLETWWKEHGQFFADSQQVLTLMIDIKQNGGEAYFLLKELCEKYAFVKDKKVQILLSGNKPYKELLADSLRDMQIDGGMGQLQNPLYPAQIVPRISAAYSSFFKWKGNGKMPTKELQQLRELVQRTHFEEKTLRFWAMPNHEKVWKLFLDEGVDWMNVDDLEGFRKFYENYQKQISTLLNK